MELFVNTNVELFVNTNVELFVNTNVSVNDFVSTDDIDDINALSSSGGGGAP